MCQGLPAYNNAYNLTDSPTKQDNILPTHTFINVTDPVAAPGSANAPKLGDWSKTASKSGASVGAQTTGSNASGSSSSTSSSGSSSGSNSSDAMAVVASTGLAALCATIAGLAFFAA